MVYMSNLRRTRSFNVYWQGFRAVLPNADYQCTQDAMTTETLYT
jgi:hypothetical protein